MRLIVAHFFASCQKYTWKILCSLQHWFSTFYHPPVEYWILACERNTGNFLNRKKVVNQFSWILFQVFSPWMRQQTMGKIKSLSTMLVWVYTPTSTFPAFSSKFVDIKVREYAYDRKKKRIKHWIYLPIIWKSWRKGFLYQSASGHVMTKLNYKTIYKNWNNFSGMQSIQNLSIRARKTDSRPRLVRRFFGNVCDIFLMWVVIWFRESTFI